jgi:pyridoxine 5'-phosphate synthase PdxJ
MSLRFLNSSRFSTRRAWLIKNDELGVLCASILARLANLRVHKPRPTSNMLVPKKRRQVNSTGMVKVLRNLEGIGRAIDAARDWDYEIRDVVCNGRARIHEEASGRDVVELSDFQEAEA